MLFLRAIFPFRWALILSLTLFMSVPSPGYSQSPSKTLKEFDPTIEHPLWDNARSTNRSIQDTHRNADTKRHRADQKGMPFNFSSQGTYKTDDWPKITIAHQAETLEPVSHDEHNVLANTLDSERPYPFQSNKWQVKIGTSIGLALDHLRWTIANTTGAPNILSELIFRDIYSVVGRLDTQITKAPWSLDAEASYGLIFEGEVQDDDFALDDRQGLFSRSISDSTDHDLQSAALLLGYDIHESPNAKLRLLIGGRVYRQRLRMTNLEQITPSLGKLPGLNSTYTATWFGPVVGAGVDAAIPWTSLFAHGHITFNPAWYWGQANWNLRSDFQQGPSFTHQAFGYGVSTLLQIVKIFGPVKLHAGGRFLLYYAEDGTDTTFFSNGNVISTNLNEVISYSLALFLGAVYTW